MELWGYYSAQSRRTSGCAEEKVIQHRREKAAMVSKTFNFEEVAKHNHKKDCWIIVHGKVYDVTPFLYEHPGGDEALLSVTGRDATLDFEDVGAHNDSAKEMMQKYFVGEVDPSTLPAKVYHIPPPPTLPPSSVSLTKALLLLFALLILGLAYALQQYYGKKQHASPL